MTAGKLTAIFGLSVVSALSFILPQFSFTVWFFLAGLFLITKGISSVKAFWYFYLYGFLFSLVVFFWITHVSVLGWLALCLYLALYWAVFGFIALRFLGKSADFLIIPGVWAVLELVKSRLFSGFGWDLLGYSQAGNRYLVQISCLFGVRFISFLVIWGNVVLSDIFIPLKNSPRLAAELYHILRTRGLIACVSPVRDKSLNGVGYLTGFIQGVKPGLKKLGVFLFILSCILFYGRDRYGVLTKQNYKNFLQVVSIQPNVPKSAGTNSVRPGDISTKIKKISLPRQADLVVLPEAAYPYYVVDPFSRRSAGEIRNFFGIRDKNILTGAVVETIKAYYNAALLLGKAGRALRVYRKIKIVPFGEYVPLRKFFKFVPALNQIGDMRPGRDYVVFNLGGKKFSVLICFEDIFPYLAGRFVKAGAGALINITDDSWFRGNPEAFQHMRIAILRAVEQNRFLLRSANTGIGCVISNTGEIIKKITKQGKDVFVDGSFSCKLPLIYKKTLYNMWGDWWMLGVFILYFLSRMLNNRNNRDSGHFS